ncbi:MAG TPA: hypothetical protein VLX29_05135, partial [Nitrospirota bacterium]|nr:hypothetical protein [Nitrospirota bacterium]
RHIENDYYSTLHLKNKNEIIQNLFFIEVRDDYSRVSQNSAVNYTQQSSFVNQTDQNIFTFNPYLVFKPSTNITVTPGYTFQDTHYKDGGGINRIDNIGYGNILVNLSSRLTVTTGVNYLKDQNSVQGYKQLDFFAGPNYQYAEKSSAYFMLGDSHFYFDKTNSVDGWYWFGNAGINYSKATLTAALNAGRQFNEDVQYVLVIQDYITASITKTMERLVLTISATYSEYEDVLLNQVYERSKEITATARYRFTPRTTGIAVADYQEVNYLGAVVNGITYNGIARIVTSNLRLDHQLTPKDTLSLVYKFTDSYSGGIATSNYINNIYTIEYKRFF